MSSQSCHQCTTYLWITFPTPLHARSLLGRGRRKRGCTCVRRTYIVKIQFGGVNIISNYFRTCRASNVRWVRGVVACWARRRLGHARTQLRARRPPDPPARGGTRFYLLIYFTVSPNVCLDLRAPNLRCRQTPISGISLRWFNLPCVDIHYDCGLIFPTYVTFVREIILRSGSRTIPW